MYEAMDSYKDKTQCDTTHFTVSAKICVTRDPEVSDVIKPEPDFVTLSLSHLI